MYIFESPTSWNSRQEKSSLHFSAWHLRLFVSGRGFGVVFILPPSLSVTCVSVSALQWHPTPVLLPGKSHGQRSLVGCSPFPKLQSILGSLKVGHDWATSLSLFTFMYWRRKWQPTPLFLPGESHGRWSLVGCRLWGHTESDTTEAT